MNDQGKTEYNPKALLMSPELKEAQDIMPMSTEDRQRLKDDIKKNGLRHPIIVYKKGKEYYILAGWNRREIAIELNISPVDIQIMSGTEEEFKTFVITENLSRRHLTTEQKKDLIKYLLKADHKQSNKSIAKKTGTTKETVKAHREKLEDRGEIIKADKVLGADGKEYKKKVSRAYSAQEAPGKAEIKKADKIIVNYEKAYTRLLNVVERYIKANPKGSGIKELKTDIENIKNITGEN